MPESLNAYTERALRATYDGTLIPPIVYIPAKLRRGRQRLTSSGFVTTNAKTPEEVEAQIAQADPAGLLIALMQGQPIPAFKITPAPLAGEPDRIEITTHYVTADLELRADVAWRLSQRQRARKMNEDTGYAARIKEAALAADAEADE